MTRPSSSQDDQGSRISTKNNPVKATQGVPTDQRSPKKSKVDDSKKKLSVNDKLVDHVDSTSASKAKIKNVSRWGSQTTAQVAASTARLLPELLPGLPSAPPTGIYFTSNNVDSLDATTCPGYTHSAATAEGDIEQPGVPISVIDMDTFDAALQMGLGPDPLDTKPIAVLNNANQFQAGGAWLRGATAQEEQLCFRSSLISTLKSRFYPMKDISGIYSPTVVIFRDGATCGYTLTDASLKDLPIVSVLSVAADDRRRMTRGSPVPYKYPEERALMKAKIRIVLRMAAVSGNRRLVLGALGCGVFAHPPAEVAKCFKDVFQEVEFSGGWWRAVTFAILSGKNKTNFNSFKQELEGCVV
ncbi:MAG: hypothetical protein M1833_001341 [Piccolia ochrophora]|nr:MAG: hypothetical protein M1833_001341 [Piccolia ochrophora]